MATYNERIAQNNADLLALEAEVKALPDLKPEQEKTVTVTKNGDTVVTPDTGKTLSKATVKVAVPNNTSDATATAAEVFAGKTAYLANGKHSGTFTIEQELADQTTKLNALEQALQGKAGGGSAKTYLFAEGNNGYKVEFSDGMSMNTMTNKFSVAEIPSDRLVKVSGKSVTHLMTDDGQFIQATPFTTFAPDGGAGAFLYEIPAGKNAITYSD